MRHQTEPTRGRAVSISDDGGETFGPITYDNALIGPICEGSIVTHPGASGANGANGAGGASGGVTYFSNPASPTSRINITIRRSVDNAQSWGSSSFLVDAGSGFGYTSLVSEPLQRCTGTRCTAVDSDKDGKGGILWEAWNGTIMFAPFPLTF